MLDNFLKELFGSPALATPAMAGPSMAGPAGPGGMSAGIDEIPLPRARPDVEGILAGTTPAGPAGMPPPDVLARLMGPPGGAPPMGPPQQDPRSVLGNLMGMSGGTEKRMLSGLAGGMAGGDPAFKGGAFMKGMSGGLTSGLASEKEDAANAKAADDTAWKRGNDVIDRDLKERTVANTEKMGEATRNLYGVRGEALKAGTTTGRKGAAWNKPSHERYKDAMKLIQDERKVVMGGINPLLPKAELEAQRGVAQQKLDAFEKNTLKQYGLDKDGNDVAPEREAVAPSARVWGDKEAENAGLYEPSTKGMGTVDMPHTPQTREELDAIPRGEVFINPADGRPLTKR